MKRGFALFAILLFMHAAGYSQTGLQRIPPNLNAQRNEQAENTVAKLFDTVRRENKLRGLTRIEDRKSLQQLVCSVAITGEIPRFWNDVPVLGSGPTSAVAATSPLNTDVPSALYKTSDPAELTQQLKEVALFERPRGRDGHYPGFKRYAVAVWSDDGQSGAKPEYWVGVQLYWSEGAEFF